MNRLRNFSKTKMNALAITRMNEYWMNALSQPQKIHSSVGTMKNGTNSGPTKRTDGARDHAEGHDEEERELRQADDEEHRPVEQVRENRPGVGLVERVPQRVEVLLRDWIDRALTRFARYTAWSVIRFENEMPRPGIGELVVGDHRVAERDDEQEPGKAEHVLARLRARPASSGCRATRAGSSRTT